MQSTEKELSATLEMTFDKISANEGLKIDMNINEFCDTFNYQIEKKNFGSIFTHKGNHTVPIRNFDLDFNDEIKVKFDLNVHGQGISENPFINTFKIAKFPWEQIFHIGSADLTLKINEKKNFMISNEKLFADFISTENKKNVKNTNNKDNKKKRKNVNKMKNIILAQKRTKM
jgi:hypothetical protein